MISAVETIKYYTDMLFHQFIPN